jgi:hypothetical protein
VDGRVQVGWGGERVEAGADRGRETVVAGVRDHVK